jgi:hypothetical protein
VVAVELGLVVLPQAAHGEEVLPPLVAARPVVDAVVLHLVDVPAEPDAEGGAATGEVVEGGDGLGGHDRVALGDEEDAGAEAEGGRRGRGRGEGDEGIEGAAVLVGQVVVGRRRPRRAATRRDVGVLREPQRVEAALLERPGELDQGHRKVGREGRHAVADGHNRRF